MKVKKSDGSEQEFSWTKIEAFYKRVNHWLNVKCPYSKIEEGLKKYLVEGIGTEDINNMIIKSAIELISPQNISWQNIAGRMMMKNLYKQGWTYTQLMKEFNISSKGTMSYIINNKYQTMLR